MPVPRPVRADMHIIRIAFLRAFFAGEAPLSPRFDGDYNAVGEAGI